MEDDVNVKRRSIDKRRLLANPLLSQTFRAAKSLESTKTPSAASPTDAGSLEPESSPILSEVKVPEPKADKEIPVTKSPPQTMIIDTKSDSETGKFKDATSEHSTDNSEAEAENDVSANENDIASKSGFMDDKVARRKKLESKLLSAPFRNQNFGMGEKEESDVMFVLDLESTSGNKEFDRNPSTRKNIPKRGSKRMSVDSSFAITIRKEGIFQSTEAIYLRNTGLVPALNFKPPASSKPTHPASSPLTSPFTSPINSPPLSPTNSYFEDAMKSPPVRPCPPIPLLSPPKSFSASQPMVSPRSKTPSKESNLDRKKSPPLVSPRNRGTTTIFSLETKKKKQKKDKKGSNDKNLPYLVSVPFGTVIKELKSQIPRYCVDGISGPVFSGNDVLKVLESTYTCSEGEAISYFNKTIDLKYIEYSVLIDDPSSLNLRSNDKCFRFSSHANPIKKRLKRNLHKLDAVGMLELVTSDDSMSESVTAALIDLCLLAFPVETVPHLAKQLLRPNIFRRILNLACNNRIITYHQIEFDHLLLGREIAVGGAGIVHKAIFRTEEVAVKICSPLSLCFNQNEFYTEATISSVFKCNTMMTIYGGGRHNDSLFLVMPLYPCNLRELLQSSNPLSFSQKLKFAADVADALCVLHAADIVHRDLKSPNILVKINKDEPEDGIDRYTAILGDFGTCRSVKRNDRERAMSMDVGTKNYTAPEVFSELIATGVDSQYDEKADVYSFSMLVWEILHRTVPFSQNRSIHLINEIIAGRRPPLDKKIPTAVASLVESGWDQHVEARPSMQQIAVVLKTLIVHYESGGSLLDECTFQFPDPTISSDAPSNFEADSQMLSTPLEMNETEFATDSSPKPEESSVNPSEHFATISEADSSNNRLETANEGYENQPRVQQTHADDTMDSQQPVDSSEGVSDVAPNLLNLIEVDHPSATESNGGILDLATQQNDKSESVETIPCELTHLPDGSSGENTTTLTSAENTTTLTSEDAAIIEPAQVDLPVEVSPQDIPPTSGEIPLNPTEIIPIAEEQPIQEEKAVLFTENFAEHLSASKEENTIEVATELDLGATELDLGSRKSDSNIIKREETLLEDITDPRNNADLEKAVEQREFDSECKPEGRYTDLNPITHSEDNETDDEFDIDEEEDDGDYFDEEETFPKKFNRDNPEEEKLEFLEFV